MVAVSVDVKKIKNSTAHRPVDNIANGTADDQSKGGDHQPMPGSPQPDDQIDDDRDRK